MRGGYAPGGVGKRQGRLSMGMSLCVKHERVTDAFNNSRHSVFVITVRTLAASRVALDPRGRPLNAQRPAPPPAFPAQSNNRRFSSPQCVGQTAKHFA